MQKKILIIDDEAWFVEPILDRLEHMQIECDYCSTGFAGLEKVKSNRYDLIVLDMMLALGKRPSWLTNIELNVKPNGLLVLEIAQKLAPSTPVIVFTVLDDPVIRQRIKDRGGIYLEKSESLFEMLEGKIDVYKKETNQDIKTIKQLEENLNFDLTELKGEYKHFNRGYRLNSKGKVIELRLNLFKTTKIPSIVWELKNIENLSLNNNEISEIPEGIAKLKKLKTLDLHNNKIEILPKQIFGLKKLVALNLSSNRLKSIPSEIGNLKSLSYLNLEKNEIFKLPNQICQLDKLKFLMLNDNPLITPPSEIVIKGLPSICEYFEKTNAIDKNAQITLPTSVSQNRLLRVFLSYSSMDKPIVQNLVVSLTKLNIDIWFDEQNILPGQDWDFEIKEGVRNSDVVIVCLSQNSIMKAGYIQKEINTALDIADEQPEGSIFIIPLKLEPCKIPRRLGRWQWVNYFEEEGFMKLVLSLRHRQKQLGI